VDHLAQVELQDREEHRVLQEHRVQVDYMDYLDHMEHREHQVLGHQEHQEHLE